MYKLTVLEISKRLLKIINEKGTFCLHWYQFCIIGCQSKNVCTPTHWGQQGLVWKKMWLIQFHWSFLNHSTSLTIVDYWLFLHSFFNGSGIWPRRDACPKQGRSRQHIVCPDSQNIYISWNRCVMENAKAKWKSTISHGNSSFCSTGHSGQNAMHSQLVNSDEFENMS